MIKIIQDKQIDLLQTKKTVDWLVNNTCVSVFNPVDFTGYQRQIDKRHCSRIVRYLETDFFLPTAIVCATSNDFVENANLRIVDGQHRVEAFKMLKNEEVDRYDQIKDYEVPVIVMANTDENTEIDTFITINKTSKKVDTSLALVLKNKMNKYSKSDDLTMPRAEYLAVELACCLNEREDIHNLWYDKILFEGNPKKTSRLISLNAFVKSTRSLLNHMAKKRLISLDWNDKPEIEENIERCYKLLTSIWNIIKVKWSELFDSDLEKRRIIQGAIGYSSINRVAVYILNQASYKDEYEFLGEFEKCIRENLLPSDAWLPGGMFSKYSSESGYGIVSQELINYMR